MRVVFSVPFVAAQRRPRFRVAGAHVQAYKDRRDREAEARIREAFSAVAGDGFEPAQAGVPVAVAIDVFRALPTSRRETDPDTHRPDVDNYAKCFLDALNGVAWHDDAQVTRLTVTKHDRVRRWGDETRVSVEIGE